MPEEKDETPLVTAAKSIGKIAGSVAKLTGVKEPAKPALPPHAYESTYIGSGTFIIRKPKRNRTKLHQSRVKNRPRGSRA
jgi:hypothetical protein